MEPEGGAGAAAERRHPRLRAGAALFGLGWLLPAVVTALGGGFGITRNDDSAFMGTARVLADHGVFRLRGPADMTLVGQSVLVWPIARLTDSRTALQLATLTIGLVGLVAVAAFARQVLDLRRAVLVALVLAATPMWAALATSFMTDVWAFALSAVALALVAAATRAATARGFLLWAAAALLAGSWAFLVRQTAVAVLVALGVALAVGLTTVRADRPGRRLERLGAVGLAAVAAVACGLGYRWRTQWPIGSAEAPGLGIDSATLPLRHLDRWLLTLALLLLPAAVAFGRRGLLVRRAQAHPRFALGLATVIGCLVAAKLLTQPIELLTLFDYASRVGPAAFSGPQDHVAIVPWLPWAIIVVAAAANLWAIAVVLSGPWLRRCWLAQPVILATTLTFLGATAALMAISWIAAGRTFDRYLLPMVPFAALVLAWAADVDRPGATPAAPPSAPVGRWPRPVLFGLLVALSAWFGLASASFDRAAFDAASAVAARSGLDPAQVDGGLTWNERQLDAFLTPTASFEPPDPTHQCIEVRQASTRDDLDGAVVLHRRLLWVDRWFTAAKVDDCS